MSSVARRERALGEILRAAMALSAAEEGERNLAGAAVAHSLRAVSIVMGAEERGFYEALASLPPRLWGDVLRLVEMSRAAGLGEVDVEEAREAVEIAVAIFNALLGLPEGYSLGEEGGREEPNP